MRQSRENRYCFKALDNCRYRLRQNDEVPTDINFDGTQAIIRRVVDLRNPKANVVIKCHVRNGSTTYMAKASSLCRTSILLLKRQLMSFRLKRRERAQNV